MTAPIKSESIDGASQLMTWELSAGEAGDAIGYTFAADRTVQVFGTFGGASVIIEGSCERNATTFATLHNPQGDGLSFSTAGIDLVSEAVTHIRPRVSGGDGTTALTVILLMRRTNK